MRDESRAVNLDRYEQGLAITALNDKRNQLLRERRSTDAVDDLLLKIIDAPLKKAKRKPAPEVRNETR